MKRPPSEAGNITGPVRQLTHMPDSPKLGAQVSAEANQRRLGSGEDMVGHDGVFHQIAGDIHNVAAGAPAQMAASALQARCTSPILFGRLCVRWIRGRATKRLCRRYREGSFSRHVGCRAHRFGKVNKLR